MSIHGDIGCLCQHKGCQYKGISTVYDKLYSACTTPHVDNNVDNLGFVFCFSCE